tara:strand:- start:249 stop:2261 length:2013 start_codon:yes stop_codon:yes gene_type:complete
MKFLIRFLMVLAALFVATGLLLVSQINTSSNKEAISEAILTATGYKLTIGGDLSLRFFPDLGFALTDVRLKNPAFPQELASTSSAVVSVELAPLLRGQIKVIEISTADLHANYFIDANGISIWSTGEAKQSADNGSEPPAVRLAGLSAFSVDRLKIDNATIDIQDASKQELYQIDNLNLDSRNINFEGRSFSFELQFDYENNGMSASLPIALRSNLQADLSAGSLQFSDLQLSITPMLLIGAITVSGFPSEPTYEGTLTAEAFDLFALLESLNLKEAGQGSGFGLEADRMISFRTSFNGSSEKTTLGDFDVDFAGALIETDVEVRRATELTPLNVSYSVDAGALDLTPFFAEQPTEAEETAEGLTKAVQHQPQADLPVELINSISLLGAVSIDSVTIHEMQLRDVNVFTNIEDGILDIEVPPIALFEGSAQGAMRLSTRNGTPELEVTQAINNISLSELTPFIPRFNAINGDLQAESSYTANGNTLEAVLDSLAGTSAFAITENSVDIGVIKQLFTAIAALSPNGEAIQQWPDVIRFSDISGYLLFKDGLTSEQDIRLRMDNLDISGTGQIDLDAEGFNYDLLVTVLGAPYAQTIPIEELYHNVPWPVNCSAAFADNFSRYCRPNFTMVRDIFSQISSNALRNELQTIITEQVPEQLRDSARELLRSLLK